MRVIDHQRQRPLRRHVRAQPVKPVQDRERRVRSNLACPVSHARKVKQPGRHPRRPVQQPGTLPGGRPRQRRLNQLPDHTERELAFQLSTTRPQPAEALVLRGTVGSRQQRRLADPRWSLHDKRAPRAQLGPPQALAYPLQFMMALKQHPATFTRARHHSHSVTLALTSRQSAKRPPITARRARITARHLPRPMHG